jgi:type I restriction enzyme, S subunit
MIRFERVNLGSFAIVKGGKRLPIGAEFSAAPTSHPYIRARDIGQGNVRIEDPVFLTEDVAQKLARYTVHAGDICLTIVGANVGDVGVVPKDLDGANLTENAVKIVTNGNADQMFLRYALLSSDAQAQMKVLAGGAAQPKLGIYKVETIEVPFPPLPVQQRIARILSAYDELIENNQRRIRILEEMARTLYREWFVNFRFPGHEKVPLADSPLGPIPKGWEVRPVAESFEVFGGGTPSRQEPAYWENGTIQWFAPSDVTGAETMFMDESGEKITKRGLAESSARLFPLRSIMLTSRATIGAIAINTFEACTNQGFITCLPNEHFPVFFLYHWLKENVPQFERLASGATFKEISRGVFKTIHFLHPQPDLVRSFEATVSPMGEQIHIFQRQITNLRKTRDLLLPRLLSGGLPLAPPSNGSEAA